MKDEHVADPMRILSRVHQQAFFDRLAKAGLMPTTEIEARISC